VFDCGRYLRADNCSLNRERFDYARVLIATSSLEVVKLSEHIIFDGEMVEIKILEEWGFNLGDDVCLYDEEEKADTSSQSKADIYEEFDMDKNVEIMADKIVEDLVQADVSFNKDAKDLTKVDVESTATTEVHKIDAHSMRCTDCPTCSKYIAETSVNNEDLVLSKGDEMTSDKNEAEGDKNQHIAAVNVEIVPHTVADEGVHRKRIIRGLPSSDEGRKSLTSGPWSVDWLQNINKR